jgi:hypothetical protein
MHVLTIKQILQSQVKEATSLNSASLAGPQSAGVCHDHIYIR